MAVFVGACTIVLLTIPPVWQLKGGEDAPHTIRGPGHPQWVDYEVISKHTINAIIAAEDARFYSHGGIDFFAILESIKLNFQQQRYARGASTISQQLVKIAFLSQEKSLLRKIREIVGAITLEWNISKEDILAWYLNNVTFGHGTIGIQEAAEYYFNEDPSILTVQQSIQLALVLPNPARRSEGLVEKRLSEFDQRRFRTISSQMHASGYLTDELKEEVMATGDFGRPLNPNKNQQD